MDAEQEIFIPIATPYSIVIRPFSLLFSHFLLNRCNYPLQIGLIA